MAVPLFHRDLGGTGLPPLVILHGMLGSSRNWQTAGRDLAARYHVLSLDLRNHGNSPHVDDMGYTAMMEDVLAWMDAQGLTDMTLVGHSMGGKVAMLLACRFPNRVSRLVVVDIAPKDYYWVEHRSEFAAMNELDLRSLVSRAQAEAHFEAKVPSLWMRKFLATNLERLDAGGWRWIVNLPAITKALAALEKNSLKEGELYLGPTLFTIGRKSPYVKKEDQPLILRHFPNAKIEAIAEAGHNPHLDAREAWVKLVMAGEGQPADKQ